MPLSGFTPIAFGDKLIYRSYAGVHAFDIRAGKELWRAASANSMDAVLRDPGKKACADARSGLASTAARATSCSKNTITGTLSSDGKRVYAVEDLSAHAAAHPDFPQSASERHTWCSYFGPFTDRAHPDKMHNTLRALNADSGALEWEIGGSDAKTPADLRGVIFLGPPLPLGNSLFVVVEQRQDVRLLCLRADSGAVHWAQSLGVPRDKIMLDLLRRTQAVHLAYADGVLVCPTGGGAVLGIDPLSHGLLWAHNYRDRPQAAPTRMCISRNTTWTPFKAAGNTARPIWFSEGRIVFTVRPTAIRCAVSICGPECRSSGKSVAHGRRPVLAAAVSRGKAWC